MNYILFDLEFNSTRYNGDKFINEIIEIGAVKLDENFCEIDSFSEVIKPKVSKKLNKYVKTLTHISEEELKNANDFQKVISMFKKWCGKKEKNIFLTWSDTDLHVLVENYNLILKKNTVEFIANYSDLQKYILSFIKTENNNQISLGAAAEHYKIDTSEFSLHRATDDSRVCAEMLKATYKESVFKKYISTVDKGDFYKRLMFRPYYITNIDDPLIDTDEFILMCPQCKCKTKRLGKIKQRNNAFYTINRCPECSKKYIVGIRFKKTFDKVIVNRRIKEFVKNKSAAE